MLTVFYVFFFIWQTGSTFLFLFLCHQSGLLYYDFFVMVFLFISDDSEFFDAFLFSLIMR